MSIIGKILILVVMSFAALTSLVGQQFWEESKGPYGGLFSMVKCGDDTLYAYNTLGIGAFSVDWKKTYRSIDKGNTWQQLTFLGQFFPNEKDKQVFVSEKGTIYMKIPSQQSTYKTVNDGQSWEPSYKFDIELASGVMIKKENNIIFRSIDGGQNWTIVLSIPVSVVNSTLSNTPFGGLWLNSWNITSSDTTHTIYRSIDEGATWSSQEVSRYYAEFFITPNGTMLCNNTMHELLRSEDGGVTFELTGQTDIYSPSFMALGSGRLLMGNSNGLQFSDDEGITWDTLTTTSEGAGGAFYQIPAFSDGSIFKSYLGSVYRSSDGGLTWQFSGTNMRAGKTEKMVIVTDSLYYARTPVGLWKTENAGETWSLISPSITTQNNRNNFEITPSGGVAILQDQRLLWAETGVSFTDITPPNGLNNADGPNFSMNPQTGHFFITTNHGLERSIDFGQSWELLLDSVSFFSSIKSHPNGRLIGCPYNGPIYLSDNDGITWVQKQIPENPFVSAIRVAQDGDIYLLGLDQAYSAFLWKSEDAGETWTKLPQELNSNLWWLPIFEISQNGYLIAGVNENVIFSINEGLTWQNYPNPVDSIYIAKNIGRLSCLAISPNQHLYAGSEYLGLYNTLLPISQGSIIEGNILEDADGDCTTPDSQAPKHNRTIQVEGDNFTYYSSTDAFGRYIVFVDTGTYKVTVYNQHKIWWEYCDSTQTVYIPAYYSNDTIDFATLALADCPLISVNVAAPILRRCFDNEVFVQYCNQGTEPADSAWVDISLDPYLNFVFSAQSHTDLGSNNYRFFIGDLQSGDCGQFHLTVNVDCDSTILGQTHCITAHGFPDTLCTSIPSWSGANIEASVTCLDTSLQFKLQNTGTAPSETLDYIIIQDDVVMFQGQQQYGQDQSITLPVTANGHTYRIESEQEPGHPFSTLALAYQEGCGGFETLGFINQFTVNGITPSWHTVCRENIGSYDPNDKQGYPLGFGAEHIIRPGEPIEYMIRFQNTGTDTAFTVVIRDSLSSWLDPASIVPGAASHPYSWKLEGQGEISFAFSNILLPDSSTNLAGSQGFVTFRIAQQPTVPLGAKILNKAAIFFDFNTAVLTNETLHTVGETPLLSAWDLPKTREFNVVQVSPNPAGEFASFRMRKGYFNGHRLQLFSPLGKPVFDKEVHGAQLALHRSKLAPGAYGWRVTDRRGALVDSGIVVFQ